MSKITYTHSVAYLEPWSAREAGASVSCSYIIDLDFLEMVIISFGHWAEEVKSPYK